MKLNQLFFESLMLILILSFASCGDKSKSNSIDSKKIQIVSTEKIVATNSIKRIKLSGNIVGQTTVNLSFMVSGKVDKVFTTEGQSIKKGALLASLDATSYIIARNIANIQVKKATDEYQRLKLMHEKNSLSDSDLKKVEFAVEEAKNNFLMQNKNVIDTRIVSPINGILLTKQCEKGEIIETGRPVLVASDIAKVKVIAYLPESLLGQIQIGQLADVDVAATCKEFKGKVIEIAGVADQATRTFVIKIEVNNPQGIIRPGMIAEVSLAKKAMEPAITVPTSAILNSNDNQAYIFVIDRQKNKAFKRDVTIGTLQDKRIEILSGLSSNEEIVVKGHQKLVDGTSISINN
nr:efflux RND transporter periplasmic adaptor subunit [uncultured Flavobacterium sp.]